MAKKDVIAELETILSTNLSEFKRDMTAAAEAVKDSTSKIQKHLEDSDKGFGKINEKVFFFLNNLKMIGGTVIDAGKSLFEMVVKQDEFAKSLVNSADKLHISTDALQIYRKIAEDTGVSNEMLETSMSKFVKQMGLLQDGEGSLAGYLDKTNISLKNQLEGAKSTDEAFLIVMKALAKMEPGFKQTTLAMEAFGKGSAGMTVMVKDGIEAFDDQIARIKKLGIVIDEDLLRGGKEAEESLRDLADVIHAEFADALLALAPAITKVTGGITDWITQNREWIDQKVDEYIGKIKKSVDDFDAEKFANDIQSVVKSMKDLAETTSLIGDGLGIVKDGADIAFDALGAWASAMMGDFEGVKKYVEAAIKNFKDIKGTIESIPDADIKVTADTTEAKANLNELKTIGEAIKLPPVAITVDTDKAQQDMEKFITYWEEGKGWITIPVEIDTVKADSETKEFVQKIKDLKAEVLIGADPKSALASLKELKSKIELEKARVELGADPTMAEDDVRDLLKEIQEAEAAIKVLADTGTATEQVSNLVTAIDSTPATITITVDTSEATEQVKKFIEDTGIAFEELSATMIDSLNRGITPDRDQYGNIINEDNTLSTMTGYESKKQLIKASEYIKKAESAGTSISQSLLKLLSAYPDEWVDPDTGIPTFLNTSIGNTGTLQGYASGSNVQSYASGTGINGLQDTGPFIGHRGEIVLNQKESDMFRDVTKEYRYVNNNQRKTNNSYNIVVNQQVIGDRPAMTAREMANELAMRINQQKIRFGEAAA